MWYAFNGKDLVYTKKTRKDILAEGFKAIKKIETGVYHAERINNDVPYESLMLYDSVETAAFYGLEVTQEEIKKSRANSDIIIHIPLKRYLREITKDWGTPNEVYVSMTMGGQVWLSAEAPASLIEEYDGNKNYIEFNDSGIWTRIPKEAWSHINLKPGESKDLKTVLQELIP